MSGKNFKAEIPGVVVSGEGKASRLGFPTINIDYGSAKPGVSVGIYAGILQHAGKDYEGVICFGPQFGSDKLKLEIHCFENVPVSIGKNVECIFFEKISDFVGGDESSMKQKIADDVRKAKDFFKKHAV